MNLNKDSLGICDATVQFPIADTVCLCSYPTDLPFELIHVDQTVHLVYFFNLLPVFRLRGVQEASNDYKVDKVPEPLILTIPFNQASDVFHLVQPCHWKDDWFAPAFQVSSDSIKPWFKFVSRFHFLTRCIIDVTKAMTRFTFPTKKWTRFTFFSLVIIMILWKKI